MLAINIPADGLFLAVLNHAEGDFSLQNCERIINEYIGRFLEAEPDVILLNVCYRRSLTPSEVFDSYLYDIETDEKGIAVKSQGESIKTFSPTTKDVSKYFMSFFSCARELLKNGIDIYKFAIERIRQTDCRVFLSVRMNDAHYTDNIAVNSSFALKNGCVHTTARDGKNLDYSQEAVRNYYYSYIKELLETYDFDGIELDFLRYPSVLPYEKRSDFSIISDYMKKVRGLVDAYDKNVSLAVRILPTEEENLAKGFDACAWVADGSVNMITIENFYIPTNYELPVSEWKKSILKRNLNNNSYCLFCGSDWAVSCVDKYSIAMTPALVRGFTEACLAKGADGVYLFNFFEENDTSSFEFVPDDNGSAHLENCFLERIKASKQPQGLPRRYVHIGNSNRRYPISLGSGEAYTFTKTITGNFERCKIVIGCDMDVPLSVYVNDQLIPTLQKELVFTGFEYIPGSDIGKNNDFIYAVTQAAPFVSSGYLPLVAEEKETLKMKIENNICQDVNLLWIEILCE